MLGDNCSRYSIQLSEVVRSLFFCSPTFILGRSPDCAPVSLFIAKVDGQRILPIDIFSALKNMSFKLSHYPEY